MQELKIVSNPSDFVQLKDDWQKLYNELVNPDFYLSYDWFFSIIHFGKRITDNIQIITIWENQTLTGVIPLTLSTRKLRLFSYNTTTLLGTIYSSIRGCLIKSGKEDEYAEWFISFLQKNNKSMIILEDLSSNDPFIRAIELALISKKITYLKKNQCKNIHTNLSNYNDIENFHKQLSRNFRRVIAKGINQMNRHGQFDIILIDNNSPQLEQAMDDYYVIHGRSWKVSEGDMTFHRELANFFNKKDMLRLFLLYYSPRKCVTSESGIPFPNYKATISNSEIPLDSIPIASYFAIIVNDKTYGLKTSYDEKYNKFSPGTVLLWFVLKYLKEIENCRILDHQKGDESFKFNFLGEHHENRFSLSFANPHSKIAQLEILNEIHLIPKLKKILKVKKT